MGLHIGVDATSWRNPRGYGRFIRNLVRAAVREAGGRHVWVLVLDDAESQAGFPAGVEVRRVGSRRPTVAAATASSRRGLADMWAVSRALSAPDLDVVVFPTVYSYVPILRRTPILVFLHDAIPETYPELAHPDPWSRRLWNWKVQLAHWQATALGTVSDYSARALAEVLGEPAGEFHVVGEAPVDCFRVMEPKPELREAGRVRLEPGRRQLVYVGGFGPHKNLRRLLRAFAAVAPEHGDVDLLLVGGDDSGGFHTERDGLLAAVDRLRLADRVRFTGFVEDADLARLLNVATALVLPSMAEGYGLPAVEAAACGCPVVATAESPLPELLAGAGLFFDPRDEAALADALGRILGSEGLRRRLAAGAVEAVRELTWERAGRQLLAAVEATARS